MAEELPQIEELPDLTLEDIKPRFLELLNEGKHKEAVGLWLYVKLGDPEFQQKTSDAILEAVKIAGEAVG